MTATTPTAPPPLADCLADHEAETPSVEEINHKPMLIQALWSIYQSGEADHELTAKAHGDCVAIARAALITAGELVD